MQIGLLSLGDHVTDPVTGRRQTPGERHRTIVDECVLAESCGFSSVHLGEHHFLEYILSAPQVVLASIAARTSTIRLSTGVTLAANLDPVRVAEDYATVDAVSGGRVEPVFGRGTFFPGVFEVFGQEEREAKERFAESVELIKRLWAEEDVTWEGRFRPSMRNTTVHPRPTQADIPVWIGGGVSTDSIDLAARLGCRLMLPTVFGEWKIFEPAVERYKEKWEEYGRDPKDRRIGAVSHFFVARDSADAKRRWMPRYQAYLEAVHSWQVQSFRQAGLDASRNPFHSADKMLDTVAICGSPAEVLDRMGEIQQLLQLDTHILMLDMGGIAENELFEAIELTGSEVIPAAASMGVAELRPA